MIKKFKVQKSYTNRDNEVLNIFLKDVSKIPMLSVDEETELAKRVKNGDKQAQDRLVTANLRFVISVAKQYQGKGLELLDLINEGCLGLINAAERFDETRGFKFISYAVWWIRQSILQALAEQSRLIRLPGSQSTLINKLLKVISSEEQLNGDRPSNEKLSKETDIPIEKIEKILSSEASCTSLETPFGEEEGGILGDVIADPNCEFTDNSLEQKDKENNIDVLLNKLTDRESDIITMFFGLKGVQSLPYEEIGARFNMTGERIRQLCFATLKLIKKKYSNLAKNII